MGVMRSILLLFIVAVAIAKAELVIYGPAMCQKQNFNATAETEILNEAIRTSNVRAIINVLTKRASRERLEIASNYRTIYKLNLIDELLKVTKGIKLRNLIVALMTPIGDFWVGELGNAIWRTVEPDEETVNEIFCPLSMTETQQIMIDFNKTYGDRLENVLKDGAPEISLRRLLAARIVFQSETDTYYDARHRTQDAQELYDTSLSKLISADESELKNSILVTRHISSLRRTFIKYERISGYSMEVMLKWYLGAESAKSIMPIVKCVAVGYDYHVDRLHASLTASSGTDHRSLIRIFVSHSESDILHIRDSFDKRYPDNKLAHMITGVTSDDDYRYTLLSLIKKTESCFYK